MNPASNVQCTIQFYFILRKNCDLFINFLPQWTEMGG